MPRAILLLCLAAFAPTAAAADGPTLEVDGQAVALDAGLQVGADDRVWIPAGDLEQALGVHRKRLIPKPPTGRRPDKRRERDGWLLCAPHRCERYRGEVQGTLAEPSFELARVAKLLGYRHRARDGVHRIQRPVRTDDVTPERARIGRLAPDLVLPRLAGEPWSMRSARGRRLLLVTWATWSESRERLDVWRQLAQTRAAEGLRLVLVALEAEGDEHVRRYVTFDDGAEILIDARAEVVRRLPANDVGRWTYIDELGIVRAEGGRLDADALVWIDLHLAETPTPRKTPPATAPATPDLQILRERAEAEPKRVGPSLAWLDALGDAQAEERLALARALVARHPKQAPLAFRLASLLIAAGSRDEAVALLEEARRRTPRAWYLRRQYWALWQPNRYYMGPIDKAWERAQRRTEEKAFGRPGR